MTWTKWIGIATMTVTVACAALVTESRAEQPAAVVIADAGAAPPTGLTGSRGEPGVINVRWNTRAGELRLHLRGSGCPSVGDAGEIDWKDLADCRTVRVISPVCVAAQAPDGGGVLFTCPEAARAPQGGNGG